jgi:hypothetical protein
VLAALALALAIPAATASAAAPRTRITSMKMSQKGHNPGAGYYVVVTLRVGVCGGAGSVTFHVTETLSAAGQNKPVYGRSKRTVHREQPAACHTHRIRFRLAQKFFGVGRYRVAVRAKTTGHRYSGVHARHSDTID